MILGILFISNYPGSETEEFSIGEGYSLETYSSFKHRHFPKTGDYKYTEHLWSKMMFHLKLAYRDLTESDSMGVKKIAEHYYKGGKIYKVEESEIPLIYVVQKVKNSRNRKGGGYTAGYYLFIHRDKLFIFYSYLGAEEMVKKYLDEALLSFKYMDKPLFDLSRADLDFPTVPFYKTRFFIMFALLVIMPIPIFLFVFFMIAKAGSYLPKDLHGHLASEKKVEIFFKRKYQRKFVIMSYVLYPERIEFYLMKKKYFDINLSEIDSSELKIIRSKYLKKDYVNIKTKDIEIHLYASDPRRILNLIRERRR